MNAVLSLLMKIYLAYKCKYHFLKWHKTWDFQKMFMMYAKMVTDFPIFTKPEMPIFQQSFAVQVCNKRWYVFHWWNEVVWIVYFFDGGLYSNLFILRWYFGESLQREMCGICTRWIQDLCQTAGEPVLLMCQVTGVLQGPAGSVGCRLHGVIRTKHSATCRLFTHSMHIQIALESEQTYIIVIFDNR